jgi:hypothetical protein
MDKLVSIMIGTAWIVFGFAGIIGMVMGIIYNDMRVVPSVTQALLWMICGAIIILNKDS